MSKSARISVILEYDFEDDVSDLEIEQRLGYVELPKEYVENSFEYLGVYCPDLKTFTIKGR